MADRPLRVLLISGSNRAADNCPGREPKSLALMRRMADRLPRDLEIDTEDLGNADGKSRIQGCNACVSTSMALCVWPCNCYRKDDPDEPDLIWDRDLYARLDMADAWAIIGPVNWYAPSTNLKLLFDRLVCMNGGNPDESLIDHKSSDKAMALEHSPEWEALSLNHLEGRTAGFFCYGDVGGAEMGEDGRPTMLRHKAYFDPEQEPFERERNAYAPLVWQCRYSGIEVPDHLWTHVAFGQGKPYADAQIADMTPDTMYDAFDAWVDAFVETVRLKGPVPPGKYRAVGYEPPAKPPRVDIRRLVDGAKKLLGGEG